MSARGLALALVLLGGCGSDTSVDLVIDAGECTRALATSVVIRVYGDEGELVETFERRENTEPVFPTGVQLAPRGGDASRGWSIEAEVLTGDGVSMSFQRARGAYTKGVRRELDLSFDDACIGVSCRADETCRRGACVSDVEPVSSGETSRDDCPAILWVDAASGADGESCEDVASPCATMQHAVDSVIDDPRGYVLNVHGGTYLGAGREDVVELDESTARLDDDLRILRAWPGTGRPTIDASTALKGLLVNDDHVIIDGFEIHSAPEHGIAFNSTTGHAHDCVVRNCEIWGNGTGPMPRQNNEAGISTNNDVVRITIVDNVIRDNVSEDPSRGNGINANSNDELTIIGNEISGNQAIGLDLGRSDRTVVRDNIIADNPRGIETRGTGMVIEDNAICGSGSGGAILAVDGVSRFHHNTVVDSRGTALTFGGTSSWTVERNIIAFSTGFGLAGSGMADNRENLYFMNASGETDGITRSEPESDILDEDPRLADRSACDVRLGEGSPAAGRASDGSDIGVR